MEYIVGKVFEENEGRRSSKWYRVWRVVWKGYFNWGVIWVGMKFLGEREKYSKG